MGKEKKDKKQVPIPVDLVAIPEREFVPATVTLEITGPDVPNLIRRLRMGLGDMTNIQYVDNSGTLKAVSITVTEFTENLSALKVAEQVKEIKSRYSQGIPNVELGWP